MNPLLKLARRINSSVIARNLVLAACAIIVFVFVVNLLLNLFTRHGQVRVVPDFSHMTVEEAAHTGKEASLKIEINDSLYVPAYPGGVILEQTPAPGEKVKSGRHIFVTINSFRQKMVDVPYVTGFSLRQAKNNLDIAGLGIKELIYRDDIATNYVLEERCGGKVVGPSSRMQAEIGSGVTLIVGRAPDAAAPQVPKLVGFSAREAKNRLWEAGFNIGKITTGDGIDALNEHEAKVYKQSPATGSRQALGTQVRIWLTLDEEQLAKGHKQSDRDARAAAKALADSLEEAAFNNAE